MKLSCLQLYQRYASLQVLFKIFAQICSVVICKKFFDILRTSVSQKTFQWQLLTVLRSSKHSFLLQYIYITADYGLRKTQMPRVSNGNLIALKGQNIHVISDIKYHANIYSKTWLSSLLYIQQKRIDKPFQRLSKEVLSLVVIILTKNSILDV